MTTSCFALAADWCKFLGLPGFVAWSCAKNTLLRLRGGARVGESCPAIDKNLEVKFKRRWSVVANRSTALSTSLRFAFFKISYKL